MIEKVVIALLVFGALSVSQDEVLIQLSNGSHLQNLSKLTSLDYSKLNCKSNLVQIKDQLSMWAELYNDEKVIHHEIRLLSNAHKVLVENQYGRKRATTTLQRAQRVLAALRHNTHIKQHTFYQEWRENEIKSLKHQINLLQSSADHDETQQCCDRVEKLINKYLDQRKHISKQCGNSDITINIINEAQGKIDIINNNCCKDHPEVNIVGQNQEQKKQVIAPPPPPVVVQPPPPVVVQSQPVQEEQVVETKVEPVVETKTEEVHQEEQVVEQQEEVHQEEQVVETKTEEVHQEEQVVEQKEEVHQEEQVVETKTEEVHQEEQVVESKEEVHQEEQVVETKTEEVHQEEQVVETKTEEVHQEEQVVEQQEEVVVEQKKEVVVTEPQVVLPPEDEEEEEAVVEGEIVETTGVGASGEGGRQ